MILRQVSCCVDFTPQFNYEHLPEHEVRYLLAPAIIDQDMIILRAEMRVSYTLPCA